MSPPIWRSPYLFAAILVLSSLAFSIMLTCVLMALIITAQTSFQFSGWWLTAILGFVTWFLSSLLLAFMFASIDKSSS